MPLPFKAPLPSGYPRMGVPRWQGGWVECLLENGNIKPELSTLKLIRTDGKKLIKFSPNAGVESWPGVGPAEFLAKSWSQKRT